MSAMKAVPGYRSGKLVVLNRYGKRAGVRCDCGTVKHVSTVNLLAGRTRSCGCMEGGRTHGLAKTPEHTVWLAMLERCRNPNIPNYARYGARGIRVCQEWQDSFTAFLADMGPRPSSRHSIDRIDNDGNYEPGNCRWATRKEQMRNVRTNHIVEFRGQRLILTDACALVGIKPRTACTRMKRWGCSFAEAVARPVGKYERRAA